MDKMNHDQFWGLIHTSKQQAQACGDSKKQYQLLLNELSKRSVEEILSFQIIFDEFFAYSYREMLWAAFYLILGGCSDDKFDYARGWLIAQGQQVYEKVLQNPQALVDIVSKENYPDNEWMLGVAAKAYEQKTQENDFYDSLPNQPLQYPESDLEWDGDNAQQMQALYPKLFAKFWENPL